jgi:murein DD-endopeptidase MepM/ murein hydrolase activator NlpD
MPLEVTMSGYLRPVDPTNGRICTYYTHTRRTTPSSEAGVDYYCPIGTPVRAAGDGVIYAVDGGIVPATGRYVTLDLYDGRRVRYLHLSRWSTYKGAHVRRGQIIGYSGASGYGSEYFGASSEARIPANTGGPHVHTTLWPGHYYQFGKYPLQPTLDFELYVGGGSASGASTAGATEKPVVPTLKGKKMDLFIMVVEPASGGYRRYLVDVRKEAKREISSEKYELYKNAGMPQIYGAQKPAFGDEFPNTF